MMRTGMTQSLLTLILTGTAAISVSFTEARAQYKICNKAAIPAFAAIGFWTASDGWRAKGWSKIWPGECTAFLGQITNRYVYFTANAQYGPVGKPLFQWGAADAFFCATGDAFDVADRIPCPSGFERRPFEKVDVGENSAYTSNLICTGSDDCDPPIMKFDVERKRVFVYNLFTYDTGYGFLQADATTYANLSDQGDFIHADVSTLIGLGQVKAKLPSAIRQATLVDEGKCGTRFDFFDMFLGAAAGGGAELSTSARYKFEACAIVTTPQFECDGIAFWEDCKTWLDETTVLQKEISQSGSAAVRLTPVYRGSDLSFRTEVLRVRLNGLAGWLTDMFNINLNAYVQAYLDNVLPNDLMSYSVPPEIARFFVPTRAAFTSDGGLALEIEGTADMPKTEIINLCRKFWPNVNCRLQQ